MNKPLCIVGIGASAGGIEALSALLSRLPPDTGMAFVLVVHQFAVATGELRAPAGLAELLGTSTTMPLTEATHEVLLEPDRVYLMPPATSLAYADGRLLVDAGAARGSAMPVDAFLRSLALGRRSRAVGVILSGTGNDGALGIQAIKEAGGIALAQDARSARFDAMPLAAIGTGSIDVMGSPAELAGELAELARRVRAAYERRPAGLPELEDDEDVRRIFAVLRAARDVDFTLYRHTTIKRRILRRMVLNKAQTLRDYVELLRERPLEVEALYQDILIKVTHFFRDTEVFDTLRRQVFPAIIKARQGEAPVRIWVPGCSTGEEVYSLAITLLEASSELHARVPFQIFATDISEAALETARNGAYIENIAMDVSPERLRRFFTRAGKHYQIVKSIRDNCIFARQNLTRDPPFSRLDLVSCRNVLIYLEPSLQKRVIPVFHYALKPSGYLLLGASETIGGLSELLTTVDKKRKIYAKNVPVSRLGLELLQQEGSGRGQPLGVELHAPDRARPERASASTPGRAERAAGVSDAQKEADRLVMDRYAPPGVLVNAELSIVQFRGHTGPFLEPAPGEASLNILKMARRGLALELRAAIHKARRTDATVRVDGIQLGEGGPLPAVPARVVSLEVVPLQARVEPAPGSPDERWFLVLFQEHGLAPVDARPRTGRRARAIPDARVAKLERELAATREYLQVTLEEQEATNEELQSTNEELLSSNEELQSINEELETAKEEQEATNEELTMLNQELKSRNGELNRITNDLGNLLGSVDIPIVMLGNDLTIRRFTPPAGRVLHLIPSDIGRPIGDINPRIEAADPEGGAAPRSPLRADLERLISEVIDTASIRERDVRDREGRWYSMRIRPYRTHDNQIDGAVIVLVDIDRIRRGHQGEGVPIGDG